MALEVDDLSYCFFGGKPVLKNLNFRIEDGEYVALLGPNGSGKTTLALCLCGVIPHYYAGSLSGQIKIDDIDSTKESPSQAAFKVGFLFQDYESQLFLQTLRQELEFSLENLGLNVEQNIKRLDKMLDLAHLLDRNLTSLSEGEKQKAALASVLAPDPDVLILDEPSSQLDVRARKKLLKLLDKLNSRGKTIIHATHETESVAECSRFLVLKDGCLVVDSTDNSFLRKEKTASLGVEPLNHFIKGDASETLINDKTVLRTQDLGFIRGEMSVLRQVDLDFKQGQFTVIGGLNGCGKTTLLKLLIRLLKPQQGSIYLNGKDVSSIKRSILSSRLGFIFQNPSHQLFRNTLRDELDYTLRVQNSIREGAVDQIISRFKLKSIDKRSPQSLSVGEKQKTALASVLVSDPDVLLLDEPLTCLDYEAKINLLDYLKRLKGEGKTIIVASHHSRYYINLADRLIQLKDGAIIVNEGIN